MLKFVSEWLLWLQTGEYILREGGGNGCVAETRDMETTQDTSSDLTRENNDLNLGRGSENEKPSHKRVLSGLCNWLDMGVWEGK